MKRIFRYLAFVAISLLAGIPAHAQSGLGVAGLYGSRFRNHSNASETFIAGGSGIREYGLTLYRSLSLVNPSDEIVEEVERILADDSKKAVSREVNYLGGRLFYGFYAFAPVDGVNRYLLYLNQKPRGGEKMIVMYLEGKSSESEVRKLLKK